ncbi:MAG: Type 1 glutamine amidotransferase-like domain-containing protein [Candidatus Nomurabacteria bacterium]|nr:Type 1 glutamine amidotransferase-like domain-containing protein [Candidatus Nomurabacteria bacterium]
MKLILASDLSFLLKYGYDAVGIPKDQMKIGWVTTASKGEKDSSFIASTRDILIGEKYNFEEFDIEGKTSEEIRNFFKDKNVIHIEGGNTFYLLRAIRETGFSEILKELINEGRVYIGSSAGAYIMCPSIVVSDWNDSSVDRFGVTDFTALGYVPFVLRVHYKENREELVREKMKTLEYPFRILRDGQGIIVEDGKYTFMGDGEEVILK